MPTTIEMDFPGVRFERFIGCRCEARGNFWLFIRPPKQRLTTDNLSPGACILDATPAIAEFFANRTRLSICSNKGYTGITPGLSQFWRMLTLNCCTRIG